MLLGCWMLLAPTASFALDPARSLFQYNCQSWTHRDGLPVNRVSSIVQAPEGYLWLGSQKGLVRFDGLNFKLIALPARSEFPSQAVSCLSSCRDGGVWFGVSAGSFGHYDGNSFRGIQRQTWMESGMNVISLLETKDFVWIGLDAGAARMSKVEGNATAFFEQVGSCTSIYEDSKGRIWLGTAQHGLFYWQDGEVKNFPDETLKKSIIFAITEDRQGQLWLGTENGLRCYSESFQSNSIAENYNEIRALLVDRLGVLWIGTRGAGLSRFQGRALSSFRETDGLASDSITALFEDREGSLWVGTTEGLSQLSDVKFPTFSETEGLLPGSCHGVAASQNGGLWVTLDRGVSWFDGKVATNFATEAGLVSPYIKRALEAKNGDVYLLDGGKNIEILSGGKIVARYPNENWPSGIVEDSEGIIVSVGGNLFRVSTNGLTPFMFRNDDNPPFYWIYDLCGARDGGIWVASVNGVFHIRKGNFQRWGTDEGLSSAKVNSVREDADGVLWVGLTTGMARIKDGKLHCFGREDGLFDNYIYAIVPDDFGSLWMQSSHGIFRVSRQMLDAFADGKVAKIECSGYDGMEALKTIDTTEIEASGCKTRDGRIWFPNPSGVVMIDPANIYTNSSAPPVHLERVRVNGLDVTGKNRPALQPGKGELEVDYAAQSFIAPQKIQFRYRLEGFDKAWVEAGNRRSAFYANLKPGKYQFRVEACNSDGIWDTEASSFQMDLAPHFYESAWFKALAAVGAICMLLGVYALLLRHLKSRERKLEAENERLESKVRERTARLENLHRQLVEASRQAGQAEVATSVLHNVGNVLNSVNVSADLLRQRMAGSKLSNLGRVTALLRDHKDDLPRFLTEDSKGRQLLPYLENLSDYSKAEKSEFLVEMESLSRNIEHIKQIVATQQSYAKVSGVAETVKVAELVEDALSMHSAGYQRHAVQVVREFDDVPKITVDRHKVLQILVNLFHNAKYACEAARASDRKITVRIAASGPDRVRIHVADNGMGIAPENLTRIFAHGFTTRKNGHGFGLHSGALAAKEMGGSLRAHSAGIGRGATFTLELPLQPKHARTARREEISEDAALAASR